MVTLYRLLDSCTPEFEVLVAPFVVGLAEDTEIQPDVVVARQADLTDRDLPAAPALAVEVLSYSTKLIDLNVKEDRLRRAGTPAYWVVDPLARPEEARLIAWQLDPGGDYRQVADVRAGGRSRRPCPSRCARCRRIWWAGHR